MAFLNPEVATIRELRESLSQLRLTRLAIGSDGRNRVLLFAFRSITGRNQPSNSKFVFGMPAWVRSLIRPEPGRAVAYIDWSQQEFGIAGGLSDDVAMQEAYLSGDPYLFLPNRRGRYRLTPQKRATRGASVIECW
jgi:DNA polymerase-1